MQNYSRNSKSRHLFQVVNARRFWLDLNNGESKSLRVILGGVEQCSAEYVCQREEFPFYCLEFVASGQGKITFSERNYVIESGTVYSYGPGIQHRISNTGKAPLTKYYISFYGENVLSCLNDIGLSPGNIGRVKNPELVFQTFELIITNGCLNMAHAGKTCASVLESLFFILKDCVIPYKSTSSKALESFQKVKNLIDNHFLELKSLQEVSKKCGIEPAYLCRLFKRFEHNTVQQYLLARKMNYAAEILQSGDVLVKEVADRIGYSDPYQFSRAFKKIVGIAPDRFARLNTLFQSHK
ncbi:MAG: helix-turn-helix transcriptional regulator [Victivallales bacterium]|nr:helix-turn-helix transcriptional regulator [Victivallales bacterium]